MSSNGGTGRSQKTATETYQKLTQLEHVLKRPDTYVGSVEFSEVPMWTADEEGNMHHRVVRIVPGLYKIFDEVLVNAADNKVNDPAMSNIRVDINKEDKTISVTNDGKGIPIEFHEKEKIYVPELIFGNLLTSSNYDDNEEKVTGGRNGFGAKLCNIFSKKFVLETADKKQLYRQEWEKNMTVVKPHEITRNETKKSFTKVTFTPDLDRFGMTEFDDDFMGVLRRRVCDMAGTVKGVTVTLNGTVIPIKNFKGYTDLFVKALSQNLNATGKIIHAAVSDRWEIAFALSDGNGFQQMSFVNNIATTSGGTHVDHVADQISKYVIEQASKGQKAGKLQKAQVRNNMFLFVNCKINNPSFSSQTKEQLTTKVSQFGSRCDVPEKFLKDSYKATGLDDRLLSISERNAANAYKKQDGGKRRRITEYPALIDAGKAGTRESYKCTLILCEGNSAAALAKEGLPIVGYDWYGCFPLKGKVLNVRDASQDQVMKNAEIKALKKIIGLQHKKEYNAENVKDLRYGHVMLMTDQDHDGSHIKGLLMNFFESSFPGLLDVPGFLQEFVTPIVKVTIKSGPRKGSVIPFFSLPEYEKWRDSEGIQTKSWSLKYYKGLGTSQKMEMKEYFRDLPTHEKTFHVLTDGDKEYIELVFAKSKSNERKTWLQTYNPGTYLDHSINNIPITDFINKELILFSMADNLRSIPSVVDGLKPGQRKIMWVALERLRKETKVESFSGIVSMRAKYHHAETALSQTIVGLAQDFVGANNIYWLLPIGGFGSRDAGGKDSSSERYISTNVTPITRTVFSKEDANILTYMKDDESTVEPEFFAPILPALLINGSEGIGTGWSTNIPSYNPTDIVTNLKRMINGEQPVPMAPWYRGWTGSIEKVPGNEHQWRVAGSIEQLDETTLAITELPVKVWTNTMKEFLFKSTKGHSRNSEDSDKEKEKIAKAEFIEDVREAHTDYLRFIVTLSPDDMREAKNVGLYKKFKLITTISTSNLVAFDPQGRLRRYNSPEDILKEFYHVRLDFYVRRCEYIIRELQNDLQRLSHRAAFIKMIIENKFVISNKRRKVIEDELADLKFPMFIGNAGKPYWREDLSNEMKQEIDSPEDNAEEGDDEELAPGIDDGEEGANVRQKPPSYDYLLNMHIASLTLERYQRIMREQEECESRLQAVKSVSPKELWLQELDKFLEDWKQFLQMDHERRMTPDELKKPSKRKSDSKASRSKRVKTQAIFDDAAEGVMIPPPPIEDSIPKPKAAPKPRVKKEVGTAQASPVTSRATSEQPTSAADAFQTMLKQEPSDLPPSAPGATTSTSAQAKRAPKKAAPKKAPSKRKAISDDDSDVSMMDDDDDDVFTLSD